MHTMTFMTSSYLKLPNRNHGSSRKGAPALRLLLLILILAALASCKQDPVSIGLGLLPSSDFIEIKSTDTVGIRAYTMYDELSLSNDYSKMIAGSLYDTYFGSTYCDFVTQLRVMSQWPAKPFVIDSVFLTFVPSKVTGDDSTVVHYIRLCETGTELTDSTEFFTGQDPDTIKYLGEYRLPRVTAGTPVAIKLFNWVGDHIMRDTSMFSPASQFYKEYFRGLYFSIRSETTPILVEMDATENAAIDPLGLTIFYHSDTLNYNYSFVATPRAVNYNRFTHDRTTADPAKQISHVNDLVIDTAVFLQTYAGVYTKLDMPSLEAYRNVENLAVNKARIIAPVHLDGEAYLEKDLPARIYVRYRDADGREVLIPDLSHDVSFMDGTFYNDRDSYIFNITSFVQKYLRGEIDEPSVELFFPLSAVQNVIFKANTNEPAFKLEFAYTLY
ncbi:MAG TPA: hypothetical protein DIS74_04020 [Bacteroidales bacterium]|nr:hypothetical protein [Bacteroidales bacterium]